ARVSSDNKFESAVINGTQPDVALKYGRELLSFEQHMLHAALDAVVVAGESGAGSTSAGTALRPTTDFFGGSRPDGPSVGNAWQFQPALRTAAAAAAAGAAALRVYKSGRERGSLTAFLQPDLRPGTVFEVQELPAGLDTGPFWVTRVAHHLS